MAKRQSCSLIGQALVGIANGDTIPAMCNLYRMKGRLEEVAGLFRAQPAGGANFSEEVYPGYPGLVIAEGVARNRPR